MQSWSPLWKRWKSRADRVQPATQGILIWLAFAVVSFVLGSFVPAGVVLWGGLWLALMAVYGFDLAVLLGWGVPDVARTIASRWQIGIAADIVIGVQAAPAPSARHSRSLLCMQFDAGVPEHFTVRQDFQADPLEPGGIIRFVASFAPTRRGVATFAPVDASWRSPCGLWRRLHRYDTPDSGAREALVLPDLSSWQKEVVGLQRTLHDEGRHVKRLASGNTAFSYIAEYTPDDDPRQINWAATARRARVMRNVYEPERGQHVIIAIDASRYMNVRLPDGKRRIDYAVECAAALAQTAIAVGDSVGVTAFTNEILLRIPPGRSPAHYAEIVQQLAGVEARSVQGGYEALLGSLAGRFRRRSLLFILSEMEGVVTDIGFFPALASFQRRHPTLFVTVADVQALQRLEWPPASQREAARVAAAEWVLRDRDAAKRRLTAGGVQVIESMPGGVVVDAVREYLQRKRRPLF